MLAADDDDDLLSDDDLLIDADSLLTGDDDDSPEDAERPRRPDMREWRRYGGWRLDGYRLEYRPTRHADAFFRGWHSLSALGSPALFAHLSDRDAAGRCAKCHASSPEGAKREVYWTGLRVSPDARGPVFFSHAKHASVLGDRGCLACHALRDADSDGRTAFPNFSPMEKNACAECHNRRTGLSECSVCHNYHFGEARLNIVSASSSAMDSAAAE